MKPIIMDKAEYERMSLPEIRQRYLDNNFLAGALLNSRERQDFIDGSCILREYEGQVIVDYTQKWGDK